LLGMNLKKQHLHNYKMVRTSKPSVTVPVVAAPTVTVSVEKVAKKRAPKEAVVVAPVVVAPVVEEPVDAVEASMDKTSLSSSLTAEIAEFNKNFQMWVNMGSALKNNIKNISKISSRVSKCVDKSSKKKKSASSKLSGFEKPTLISDDLAVFFGREPGSRMARTEVSKKIHEYVTTNNLQHSENRRIIKPDQKLKKLLDSKDDELTYFNLQKYLKHHFKKDVVA